MSAGPPSQKPERRRVGWLVGILVIVVLLIVAGVVVFDLAGSNGGQHVAPPIVNATLTVSKGAPLAVLNSSFFGLNVRIDQPLGSVQSQTLTSTPVRFVRWPGGAISDRYNATAQNGLGIIYAGNGLVETPSTTTRQFVLWCESINCQAIFTLPAEINEPGAAVLIVNYTEKALGFHPAYWEIGNEPALWTHFGVPWSNWVTGQQSLATPSQYAAVVRNYTLAIRGVDPAAQILGLGGVGVGSYSETAWINATVSVNGPRLNGVAIHLYPAGIGEANTTYTPSQFFGSLSGPGSLPGRVPSDLAAIQAACSSCHIPILVDEFGAGSGSLVAPYLSTFALIPFVADELIQGMELNMTSMDYFTLQGPYPTAWLSAGSQTQPVFSLFSTFSARFPTTVLSVTPSANTNGLYAVAGESTTRGGNVTVWVVNTNPTTAYRINLTGSGFPTHQAVNAWWWNGSSSSPVSQSWSSGFPSTWVIPPEGVYMWSAPGPSALQFALAHPLSFGVPLHPSGHPIAARLVPLPTIAKWDDELD